MRKKALDVEGDIFAWIRGPEEKWPAENGGHFWEAQKAVRAAFEYGLRAIEGKEDRQAPPDVVAFARELAWRKLDTDTVVLACLDCEAVFKEHLRQVNFAIQSRSQIGYVDAERALERVFKPLRETVAKEHKREANWLKSSPKGRLLEVIEQMLFHEMIHPPDDLGYDFSATHIGVVGSGPGVEGEIKRLAKMLDGELLIVQGSPDRFWAWIGLKLESSADRLDDVLKGEWADTVRMGVGEPTAGLSGWRRTHREAVTALHVATRLGLTTARYRAVALRAAILSNALLKSVLKEQFLTPLADARDEGQTLRAALRAYFAANRTKKSAAITLGISRQMLSKYLRKAEERIGQPLAQCASELEAALLLDLAGKEGE